ncbi:MAG: terminase large subunit [Lachnospiraceae bacterium]|nr:terminase large subunit [Lachnospiraceae bacterium]
MMNCEDIRAYLDMIAAEEYPVCREQKLLRDHVKEAFQTEDLLVDEEQLEKYMNLQKYFSYELFPWEKFLFTVHNCVYKANGRLRWPDLFCMVGRGAGKNGYLAFEDFALLTPVNGVEEYHIDIFANSEDQAETTFKDIYNVLEKHKQKLSRHFYWNKEIIRNLKTRSELKFRTSNAKTKDGGRPGKVDFDEYHQYENYKTIEVAETGLGKKTFSRKTIITTNGTIRDGPLDHMLERAEGILSGKLPDNGLFPFICRLDRKEEVDDKRSWHKANPSLRYFPELQDRMAREYEDYKLDKIGNSSFVTRRMNLSQGAAEAEVTEWKNLLAASRELPDLEGRTCMAGIDYASTTDFVAAGLLFEVEDFWYWITHTWVCRNQASLSRIRFPLEEAAAKGLLTFVDQVEIPPELPALWLEEKAEKYSIAGLAIDKYRYTLLSKALRYAGFNADKSGAGNIKLVRPSDIMQIAPTITSQFANQRIIWEDNPLMRWYTNNAKQMMDSKGNITYGKIEPKSRKTDGFMALVMAATRIGEISGWNNDDQENGFEEVYTF